MADIMNFIDISSWQKGLDLSMLFSKNPLLDGVIVKASEGTSYVNPEFHGWIKELIRLNKPFGFYHFLDGNSTGEKEAEHFCRTISNYFGKGVPIADYEGNALKKGPSYVKAFLDRVYKLTGIRPLIYMSLSVIHEQDFSSIASAGYKLWLAQYADSKFTGIIDTPWQKGSVSPFPTYVMHQYTDHGRLNGWNQNLDLDKFYGSEKTWSSLFKMEGFSPVTVIVEKKKSVSPEIVRDVLDGKYGILTAREKALKNAGYNAVEVQKKIDDLYICAEKIKSILKNQKGYEDLVLRIAQGK